MRYIKDYSVWNSVQRSVRDYILGSIWDSVAASVWIPVRDQEENIWESMFWDQLEAKRIKHEIHR